VIARRDHGTVLAACRRMGDIGWIRGSYCVSSLLIGACAPGAVSSPPPGAWEDASDRLPTGELSTTDVRMVDLDGDVDLDLVWVSQPFGEHDMVTDTWELPGRVDITMNRDDATFDRVELPADFGSWTFVEPIDVDLDGDPDLVFTRPARITPQVAILLNDGAANFTRGEFPESTGELDGLSYSRIAAGDFDADGDPDLVLPIFSSLDGTAERPNLLFLNDGSGRFSRDTEGRLPVLPPDSDYTLGIAADDFDGDGAIDLVLGEAERQSRFLRNDGRGFFEDATGALETGTRIPADMLRAYRLLPADVDDDGDRDLVVVNDAAMREGETLAFGNFVLPNDGDATFGLVRLPADSLDSRGLAIEDVNRDGITDVVVGNGIGGYVDNGGNAIEIFHGDGSGDYVRATRVPRFHKGVFGVAVGDVDGDSWPDIAGAVAVGDPDGGAGGDLANILLLSR
jgi:hypothetical protein